VCGVQAGQQTVRVGQEVAGGAVLKVRGGVWCGRMCGATCVMGCGAISVQCPKCVWVLRKMSCVVGWGNVVWGQVWWACGVGKGGKVCVSVGVSTGRCVKVRQQRCVLGKPVHSGVPVHVVAMPCVGMLCGCVCAGVLCVVVKVGQCRVCGCVCVVRCVCVQGGWCGVAGQGEACGVYVCVGRQAGAGNKVCSRAVAGRWCGKCVGEAGGSRCVVVRGVG